MKYRDPETGEFKELYVKAADTLPVGTEVDYDGDEVPAGWEEVEDHIGEFIQVGLAFERSIPSEVTTVNFDVVTNNKGNSFTLLEDGTIKIGKNVKKIAINLFHRGQTSKSEQTPILRIYKNNIDAIVLGVTQPAQWGTIQRQLPNFIVDVTEGDIIKVTDMGNGSYVTWFKDSYMNITVVD